MTPPFLLDTSALLAHYCREPGHEMVTDIFERYPEEVFASVINWLEFKVRLRDITTDAGARSEVLDIYEQLLTDLLPVTRETAELAFAIRKAASTRLPNSDALIAATARTKGATLIHRDPHFLAVPDSMLSQLALPENH
jgi:predicted nucleic acid-binding protein